MAITVKPIDSNRKIYTISGNHYFQEEIKWIQFQEILNIFSPVWDVIQSLWDMAGGEEEEAPKVKLPSFEKVASLLGGDLNRLAALVLVPQEKTVKERDIEKAKEDLLYARIGITEEVIADFFTCNDVLSLVKRITKRLGGVSNSTPKKSTGKKSNTPSQAETSKSET